MKVSYLNKHEARFHHTLSNGQHCAMYVNFNDEEAETILLLDIGFAVGNSRRQCNDWWSKNGKGLGEKTTGRVGLEALLFASECLDFIESIYAGEMYVIRVGYADERRRRAYKRLLKKGYIHIEGQGYCKPLNNRIAYCRFEDDINLFYY